MIRTSSSAKSPLGSDSETPPALASIGCSQPTRHEPKWAALTPARPKSHNHCAELLVGVTLKPWRPGLPFMQLGVVIANRHLDLWQALFVEYFVLRDHLVHEEQVGRQRIDLIGGESPLIPERHAAMDEIPHRRRKRRAQWQYALPFPDGNILAFFRFQRGRQLPYARFAMADEAPLLLKDLCALLGGAAARREFLSRRTDRDIQGADFFCGRSATHAICGRRLRERGAPEEQQNRDKPKRAHWSRSRPWRSSTA